MADHEAIALGERAGNFREDAEGWFDMLRAAELATIALNFEQMTPENEANNMTQIAQSGARLSAIAELVRQLHSLEAKGAMEQKIEEEQ